MFDKTSWMHRCAAPRPCRCAHACRRSPALPGAAAALAAPRTLETHIRVCWPFDLIHGRVALRRETELHTRHLQKTLHCTTETSLHHEIWDARHRTKPQREFILAQRHLGTTMVGRTSSTLALAETRIITLRGDNGQRKLCTIGIGVRNCALSARWAYSSLIAEPAALRLDQRDKYPAVSFNTGLRVRVCAFLLPFIYITKYRHNVQ